ncbi:nucleoside hydrolase [Bacillus massiliglaciei]|uniref:nucleoside hydrolase n=1 Tax=Bacillus massiliglaciei TaxID=1816693 RepID=UPI000AAD397E|nr:nucleoside hydrolase [Bacillus massiliglaciei]
MAEKVIIFTDLGIDDAFTLIYSFFRDDLEILGIVADYGNVPREDVIRNINYIKYVMHEEHVPVFLGASMPLTGIPAEYFPEVHGPVGLGPLIPPDISYPVYPLNDLYGIVDQHKNNLTIINLGRLSSLATAFVLNLEKMRDLPYICMGGAFFYPGNITAVAEANFYSDPYAANLILEYATNLTLIPLNITQHAILTPEMVNHIDEYHQKTRDPGGLILKPMLDYYYNYYSRTMPGIKGSPIHDFMTVWYLLYQEFAQISKVPIKVVAEKGAAFGQSIADFRRKAEPAYKIHNVVFNFNYETLQTTIMETLLKIR